jgi:pimeloyl-ACP methyl ester carboxylesterase
MAERFCDVGRGITLCYETFGDPADPPVLLIMGLGTQMLGWHEDFCAELAARGFLTVRFDNRDTGRSTHLADRRPPTRGQLLRRRFGPGQYRLADMADDASGLLRELELAPAHVVGASMGGMIAQTLAAHHPELVRTLVSIMSTTGSRLHGQPTWRMYRSFLRRAPRGREAYIEYMTRLFSVIGSSGPLQDLDQVRELIARGYDRDHDPAGPGRQLAAILASGNRTADLRRIAAPTLVIHGAADPLISLSGGRATARAIPDAELMVIDEMGHDLPRPAWPRLIDAIASHARQADGVRRAA